MEAFPKGCHNCQNPTLTLQTPVSNKKKNKIWVPGSTMMLVVCGVTEYKQALDWIQMSRLHFSCRFMDFTGAFLGILQMPRAVQIHFLSSPPGAYSGLSADFQRSRCICLLLQWGLIMHIQNIHRPTGWTRWIVIICETGWAKVCFWPCKAKISSIFRPYLL